MSESFNKVQATPDDIAAYQQPSLVVTIPEALRLLQISRNSLYRMFASGELKRINIAGRVVVRRVDLEALVNKEPMPPSRPLAPRQPVALPPLALRRCTPKWPQLHDAIRLASRWTGPRS